VSAFALDEPLPPLSTDIVVHSRSALLIKLARARNLTLRQLYHLCASARGHQIVVGTAEQVAQHMIDWVRAGAADGFNIMPAYFPGGLEEFLNEAVPILQARGEFRREYEADTLRGNLGLPLPR
jgi:alkanesulfonate monooxygenase SsuD/methylene tetrahydromethanopterin reductase-like flavin-dependent oxidoreductase (luciferase family)